MQKTLVIICCLVLLLTVPLAAAQATSAPKYQVTLLNQEPDPVEPGEVVRLRFQVENTGDTTSQNTVVKIVPQFPLIAFGIMEKNIGVLRSAQDDSELQIVEFTLKIDPAAVEDDAEFDIIVSAEGFGQTFDFSVDIQTRDAVLALEEIFTQPPTIPPGGDAQVMIKLTNLADTTLKDVRVELDFSDEEDIIPFASSTEKRVAQITSGNSEWVSFGIKVQPEAAAKGYKIPATLTYYDDRGGKYTKETFVGLTVGDEPTLLFQVSRSDVFTAGSAGLVTIEVANPGLVDVKLLTLEIKESDDFILLSPQIVFAIGDVDSDDRETEEVRLYINKGVKGDLEIPVVLTYRDANNKLYSGDETLIVPLYSSRQAKKFGLVQKRNTALIVVIILVVAGLGYWWWRKRKAKKK